VGEHASVLLAPRHAIFLANTGTLVVAPARDERL